MISFADKTESWLGDTKFGALATNGPFFSLLGIARLRRLAKWPPELVPLLSLIQLRQER
jgi:hypothetical protein